MGRKAALAIAASSFLLTAACSSSADSPAVAPTPASSSRSSDAVQQYLAEVNALCDDLQRKVVALNGGQFDIPLKDFLAQLRQHTRLRHDFDRRLATIVEPEAAATKAKSFANYIAFANKLDAARLRTAREGAAAYQREIRAEQKTAAHDPSIAALSAAGFSDSCTAR